MQVNFTSLAKYGTIEFRQHEGTVDAKETLSWVDFLVQFVTCAVVLKDADIQAKEGMKADLEALFAMAK